MRNARAAFLRTAASTVLAILLAGAAAAQVPPAVKFIIGGLNAQLPRKLGNDTTLTRVRVTGGRVDVELVVEPGSSLAGGVDVRSEAARLCGIDLFRALVGATKAQLRVAYVKPDQSPIGEFVIDRTICAE